MSPTSTEQNELQQPEPSSRERAEPRSATSKKPTTAAGFFQRNPAGQAHRVSRGDRSPSLAVGWYWWDSRHWESTDDAQIDGHIYPISARVGGQVIKVNVDDGQFVHKGDVLVQIDPTDYKVALDRAQADYQDAQANRPGGAVWRPDFQRGLVQQIRSAAADMSSAQAGVAAAQKQVEAAQAQVVEAQANATEAERRCRALPHAARQERDLAAAVRSGHGLRDCRQRHRHCSPSVAAGCPARRCAGAIARRTGATPSCETPRSLPSRCRPPRPEAKSADAQVLRYKAALDQAQLNLSYTTIVAPVDGIVGKRSVQVGQNVAPGQDLMAIVPLREIWVTANFKETQLDAHAARPAGQDQG